MTVSLFMVILLTHILTRNQYDSISANLIKENKPASISRPSNCYTHNKKTIAEAILSYCCKGTAFIQPNELICQSNRLR